MIFLLVLAAVAVGIVFVVAHYRSGSPIVGEALLHVSVPPQEALTLATSALEQVWNDRTPNVDVPGLRVCVTTGINHLTAGEHVCVEVRARDDGSALTVSSAPRFSTLVDYGRSARNARRVAEILVGEGAELRYPL